jgi:lipopolysaccharide transport system permease protein
MTASDPAALAAPKAEPGMIVVRATSGLLPPRLNELWNYRELFGFLVWRDIKVRYAQTVLGGTWTIFQPVAMVLVFTYAFATLASVDTGDVPYPLFAVSGLVVWLFVSRAVLQGASSLVNETPLVTKTPSPRLLIPVAAVASAVIDFVISLLLFVVLDLGYGRVPSVRILLVPVLLVPVFALTLGLAFLLSALNVRYRDVGQALPFIVQLWFFLSPVAYLLQTPGHSVQTILQVPNPMFGLIGIFRWALVDAAAPTGSLILALVVSFGFLAAGLAYFAGAERTLADDV